ncbi:hypothetical protein PR202_ga18176 [Eleusine coracana subsp. coracana]|uniref:Pectate lyase N-terminal domain-containing protein n=1 Tax=Eleusine coracana subsp. coracana TaxID=191504 RepID=A0AAV5CSB3_ELECO|nr:hypothetical protein PR202_ga18176 [Eleusine coracana subsp. coracana]
MPLFTALCLAWNSSSSLSGSTQSLVFGNRSSSICRRSSDTPGYRDANFTMGAGSLGFAFNGNNGCGLLFFRHEEEEPPPALSILFYVLAAGSAALPAPNATADEEYWAKRAQIAGSINRGAFVSDPIETMNRFNNDVQKSITNDTAAGHGNKTRRGLRRSYKGPCVATNPIDQCWRCHENWAENRKQLAKCAMGFGHRATGGYDGQYYVVTDPSDGILNMVAPREGTLRNMNPTIISQGNRFRAVDDRNYKEVTKREYTPYNEYKNWVWKSQDDVFLNGAYFNESGGQNERIFEKLDFISAKSGKHVSELTQFSGALNCRVGKKC